MAGSTGRLVRAAAAPEGVLIVSAHWEEAPLALGATRTVRLVHDFFDFTYKAPAGRLAHPRTEHFAPLFVTLGPRTPSVGWTPCAV